MMKQIFCTNMTSYLECCFEYDYLFSQIFMVLLNSAKILVNCNLLVELLMNNKIKVVSDTASINELSYFQKYSNAILPHAPNALRG